MSELATLEVPIAGMDCPECTQHVEATPNVHGLLPDQDVGKVVAGDFANRQQLL